MKNELHISKNRDFGQKNEEKNDLKLLVVALLNIGNQFQMQKAALKVGVTDPFAGRTQLSEVEAEKAKVCAQGGRSIDILLKETETFWMLTLIGTCAEIEDDDTAAVAPGKKPETKKDGESQTETELISHRYDLNQKWSQTIDFPRKKKGTQSDAIVTRDIGSQVVSKDLLF